MYRKLFILNNNRNVMSSLEELRHSCAHLLAAAVMKLYPDTKRTIGPAIDDGFYFDFEFSNPISEADFPKIESEMKKILQSWKSFEKHELSSAQAKKEYPDNTYKYELIDEFSEHGKKKVSFYKSGAYWDLCKGGHVEHPSKELQYFKLLKVAGAYWRGSEKNKMLTRIYGTAFPSKKELDDHLLMLEEAKKRDHRKLGKELDLFIFSDLVGPGLPLWTPRGSVIRREVENFIVKEEISRGYLHVYTPELAKVDLYKQSGHYPYYKESMYPVMKIDNEELILRPMACPHHFQLYLNKSRSYRELPIRYAELAKYFRYEKSGELSGLIRVRSFCLADAHIICRKNQAASEINNVLDLIEYVCKVFGIQKGDGYRYRLSLGDRKDEKKYYKNDKLWDEAEDVLRKVLKNRDVPFFEVGNEAAFYGPKIDIQMKNFSGKEDTAFTVQYDFVMPERFNLTFINEKGEDEKVVVVHRSSVGAIERIIGLLIEKYAGKFPVWLSPVQVVIMTIADRHEDYANKLKDELLHSGIRVEVDSRAESIGRKVRDHQLMRINYLITIGDKEMQSSELAIRTRDNNIINLSRSDFIKKVKKEIDDKIIN